MRRIGHDLRNLHAIILGQCELADYDLKKGQVKPSRITRIREVVGLCDGIIKDALFPTVTLGKGIFDLNAVVRRTTFLVLDNMNGIEPSLTLAHGRIPISGDSMALTSVMANLYMNARNAIEVHGRKDGWIHVATEQAPPHAFLRVTDNGCGMSVESIARIFLRRPRGGHGYGISSVSSYVRRLGGKVTITSGGTGQGAAFTVQLPLAGSLVA